MKRSTITILTGTLIAGSSLLSPSAWAIDSTQNAALRYYRAWTVYSQDDRSLVNDAAKGVSNTKWTAPEGVTLQWMEEIPAQLILEASSFEQIDFAIDYEEGPHALVSHLGAMRDSVRTMIVGARLKLDAGDTDGAVIMIAAGYRMSEHCTHDRVLISSLVGAAAFTMTDQMAQYANELGVLTPDHQGQLAAALSRFGRRDPFGVKNAVGGERDFMLGWVERMIANGDRDAVLGLFPLMGTEAAEAAQAELVESLDRDDNLQPEIRLARTYYNQALAAWERADAPQKLGELGAMLEDGGFGPLGSIMGANLVRLHQRSVEGETLLDTALERLGH